MIDTLGLYKVLDRLGSSRLGDVYRARDTKHGRTVAMTVVGETVGHDPERRACLVRDAHAVQACTHPSVSCLFDVGEEDGRLYLVFEFAPGDPLEALMARGPLNPRRAIEIAVQVADGLADGHAVGLLHADLRPGTIVMTPKGNAKIYNIGLAAWMSEGRSPYSAPEQRRGEPAQEASDIYALGAILFEMITAHRPSASGADSRIPADLAPILSKALADVPGDRYQSVATLAAELRTVGAALDARVTAGATPVPPRRAPARRWGIGWWLVLLGLAAVAALLWTAGV